MKVSSPPSKSVPKGEAVAAAPQRQTGNQATLRPGTMRGPIGNQATLRSRELQTKVAISEPGDAHERQAARITDQIAHGVTADSPPPPSGGAGSTVPRSVQSYIRALPGHGAPLPAQLRERMEASLDVDLRDVRIHTDLDASRSAERLGSLAYTASPHIVFRRGYYDPSSHTGQRLIAHELTHVVQQDHPAAAPLLHRFEARMHERSERVGLTSDAAGHADPTGFSLEESSATYFGNWMRDMNQVFVPLLRNLGLPNDLIFQMVSYMAAKKFGREMTPEQFGYYIPAEHIDNPGGLTLQDDLLPSQPTVTSYTGPPAPTRPRQLDTPQQDVSPTSSVTGEASDRSRLFDVDQTGTMAFIRRTNLHVEHRLDLATRAGRNPEGDMHFGAALHAIEDLFAHSNWVEMAVNQVLASDRRLLPQLRGSARHVFTYSPEVTVPGHRTRRPVLTTGTFVGADTQVSLGSELVGFLTRPLEAPHGDAEKRSEERLMAALIHQFRGTLLNNEEFRAGVRQALIDQGVPELVADNVQHVPAEQLYEISTWLPHVLPERTRLAIEAFKRRFISERALQPLGRRAQADALDARIAATSLLEFRRDQQRTARGEFTEADVAAQQEIARVSGRSVQTQQTEAIAAATRHTTSLDATPEAVLAGPSHSQLAKDHPNSPFFGLAFTLASVAVRRMRVRMLAAWDEAFGRATTPFDFQWSAFPSAFGTTTEEQLHNARDLYHQARPQRQARAVEALERGNETVERGGEDAAPYDLAAMRNDSAAQLRTAGSIMRGIGHSPGETATLLGRLHGLLGTIDDQRMERLRAQLARAAAGAQTLSASDTVARLGAAADELDALAPVVAAARRHDARASTNDQLRALRARILTVLATSPSVDSALSAALLDMLDRQISYTQVTYTSEQRRILEGGHVPGLAHPSALRVRSFRLPALATAADETARAPELQALIAESRLLLNHPYENPWWHSTVREYISEHSAQLQADMEARNEGVPFFRRP